MRNDSIIRAFRYPNYRLFWSGQAVSLIGSWMQRVALGWLVYRLTDSPMMLGLLEFSGQMPAFLLAPVAGVYLDRRNRLHILIVTQTLLLVQASILAVLVIGHLVAVWHIFALNLFFGLINAFDQPARQAFLTDVVERKEDLGNAIALNSSMFNGARLVGPSIAGLVIAWMGEGWCFLINALTFTTSLAALVLMKLKPPSYSNARVAIWQSLRQGVQYAFSAHPIRIILQTLTLVSFLGLPYTVLLPIFARDVFHGDARTLGFLTASTGIGALVGAFTLASRRTFLGLEKVMLAAISSASLAFVCISLFHHFVPALFFMVFVGFGFMAVFAAGNTILQTIVEDDKRGRVLSLYTMTFQGMTPLGALLMGFMARHIGAQASLLICGVLLILVSLRLALKQSTLRQGIHLLYTRIATAP